MTMSPPLARHLVEIERNRRSWGAKPLLQSLYAGFYQKIIGLVDANISGFVVELGSGIGNLKAHYPAAYCTDLFPNPWLDAVCDGYDLPFREGTVSHLILLDVLHHLEFPAAFFKEARRVLAPGGRVILFEPYISIATHPVYGLLHHEPVALRAPINTSDDAPRPRAYYAAQGNATRLFLRRPWGEWPPGWRLIHAEAFACFSYLLSGGYSKPSAYPAAMLPTMRRLDGFLSRWPKLFAGRCLIGLCQKS